MTTRLTRVRHTTDTDTDTILTISSTTDDLQNTVKKPRGTVNLTNISSFERFNSKREGFPVIQNALASTV